MKQKFRIGNIEGKGRGVIAIEDIDQDTLIEECPLLVLNAPTDDKHLLQGYAFRIDDKLLLALGYGSLYNHSYTPNAYVDFNLETQVMELYAFHDIKSGDEITFNYGGSPEATTKLWFQPL